MKTARQLAKEIIGEEQHYRWISLRPVRQNTCGVLKENRVHYGRSMYAEGEKRLEK